MNARFTPWNFADESGRFFAPDGQQYLCYEADSLNEVGMGGPLYGPCFWGRPDGRKVLLHDTCGGPPIWHSQGNYAALPIWEYSRIRGWKARIGVVAPSRNELILFSKRFSVLQLEMFDGRMIAGIDSPIFCPHALKFDTTVAAIERIISL